MKNKQLLINILNILLFFIIGGMVLGILLIVFGTESLQTILSTKLNVLNSSSQSVVYLFMVATLIIYGVFTLGLWHFRKAGLYLLKSGFKQTNLGKHVTIAGKSFVLSGVFWWLIDGLSAIVFSQELSISVSNKTFIYLFFIAVGIFMMLMSTVLKEAQQLKQENDLTI